MGAIEKYRICNWRVGCTRQTITKDDQPKGVSSLIYEWEERYHGRNRRSRILLPKSGTARVAAMASVSVVSVEEIHG